MKPMYTVVAVVGCFLGYTFYEPQIQKTYQEFSSPAKEQVFTGPSAEELKSEVARINLVLDKYEKQLLEKKPDIPVGPTEECKCGGTGKIVQGDGHTTDCTCPKPCACKKPSAEIAVAECNCNKEEMKEFINSAVTEAFNNYVKEYRERAAKQQAEQTQSFQPQPAEQVQ